MCFLSQVKPLLVRVFLVMSVALQLASPAQAESIYVVVHKKSSVDRLDLDAVRNIFLAKVKSFPGGGKAITIDQRESESAFVLFYSKVIGKSPRQLQSYWSKMVFSGKGEPPQKVGGNQDVIEFISSNPNMIGYVTEVDGALPVKVVYTVQ